MCTKYIHTIVAENEYAFCYISCLKRPWKYCHTGPETVGLNLAHRVVFKIAPKFFVKI